MPTKIGLAYTILTLENAAIKSALVGEGAEVVLINDEREFFMLDSLSEKHTGVNCLLCRSSSFSRSLCFSYLFE